MFTGVVGGGGGGGGGGQCCTWCQRSILTYLILGNYRICSSERREDTVLGWIGSKTEAGSHMAAMPNSRLKKSVWEVDVM